MPWQTKPYLCSRLHAGRGCPVLSLGGEVAEVQPARESIFQQALTSLCHYVEGSVSDVILLMLQEQNLYFSV